MYIFENKLKKNRPMDSSPMARNAGSLLLVYIISFGVEEFIYIYIYKHTRTHTNITHILIQYILIFLDFRRINWKMLS